MGETSKQPFELEELLFRMLSSEATGDEIALLNRSLMDSPKLRSETSRFLCNDSLMAEIFESQREADDIAKSLDKGDLPEAQLNGVSKDERPFKSLLERVNRHGVAVATIAATLIIGLFVHSYSVSRKLDRLHNLSIVSTEEQAEQRKFLANIDSSSVKRSTEVIGRVSGMYHPAWAEGATPLVFGDQITRGQIVEIDSGVVELLLSTGAKVTIEGPATFEAHSELETILSRGKLAAAAPRVARGYTVITPTAELVDIGTQFGVSVEDSGDSELHVFDGDVVARSRLAEGPTDLIHAKQEEAMRFDSVSAEPQRFAACERDFIRQITPQFAPCELPDLPTTDSLALWYAADMCEGVPEGGRVGTWGDLLIGDNDFADNAWQFDEIRRPLLVTDGAGRHALRFDGWSTFLATSPMESTKQQTIFFVCMPAPISYSNTQFLFRYGESPSLELSLGSDFVVRSWVWPGQDKPTVGELSSSPIGNEQPAVIAYQYDVVNNSAKLWVNGVLQGTATAPVAVLQSGQKFIGRHPSPNMETGFFGNLYEIVMFDGVFDDNQMQGFWEYFSRRYKLENQ